MLRPSSSSGSLPTWAASTLRPTANAAALWAAVNTGWHFLLRSSEYLVRPGVAGSDTRVLHGTGVTPRREGAACRSFAEADEVVIYIKGSKADQNNNVGTTGNHHQAGGPLGTGSPGRLRAGVPREAPGAPAFREV